MGWIIADMINFFSFCWHYCKPYKQGCTWNSELLSTSFIKCTHRMNYCRRDKCLLFLLTLLWGLVCLDSDGVVNNWHIWWVINPKTWPSKYLKFVMFLHIQISNKTGYISDLSTSGSSIISKLSPKCLLIYDLYQHLLNFPMFKI